MSAARVATSNRLQKSSKSQHTTQNGRLDSHSTTGKHQATAEQIRLASVITDKSQDKMHETIKKVMDVTGRSEDAAALALHDHDNDLNKAINSLLESGDNNQDEWQQTTKKRKNKPAVEQGSKPESPREKSKDRVNGTSNHNDRGDAPRGRGGKAPSRISKKSDSNYKAGEKPPRLQKKQQDDWKGRESDENAKNRSDSKGERGGRGRGRGGSSRGGRGGPGSRGIGRNGFGNSNTGSAGRGNNSPQFEDPSGPQIDTWTNETAARADKKETWGESEDWGADEWSGPLDEPCIFESSNSNQNVFNKENNVSLFSGNSMPPPVAVTAAKSVPGDHKISSQDCSIPIENDHSDSLSGSVTLGPSRSPHINASVPGSALSGGSLSSAHIPSSLGNSRSPLRNHVSESLDSNLIVGPTIGSAARQNLVGLEAPYNHGLPSNSIGQRVTLNQLFSANQTSECESAFHSQYMSQYAKQATESIKNAVGIGLSPVTSAVSSQMDSSEMSAQVNRMSRHLPSCLSQSDDISTSIRDAILHSSPSSVVSSPSPIVSSSLSQNRMVVTNKPLKSKVPPPSKIPASAVEMPSHMNFPLDAGIQFGSWDPAGSSAPDSNAFGFGISSSVKVPPPGVMINSASVMHSFAPSAASVNSALGGTHHFGSGGVSSGTDVPSTSSISANQNHSSVYQASNSAKDFANISQKNSSNFSQKDLKTNQFHSQTNSLSNSSSSFSSNHHPNSHGSPHDGSSSLSGAGTNSAFDAQSNSYNKSSTPATSYVGSVPNSSSSTSLGYSSVNGPSSYGTVAPGYGASSLTDDLPSVSAYGHSSISGGSYGQSNSNSGFTSGSFHGVRDSLRTSVPATVDVSRDVHSNLSSFTTTISPASITNSYQSSVSANHNVSAYNSSSTGSSYGSLTTNVSTPAAGQSNTYSSHPTFGSGSSSNLHNSVSLNDSLAKLVVKDSVTSSAELRTDSVSPSASVSDALHSSTLTQSSSSTGSSTSASSLGLSSVNNRSLYQSSGKAPPGVPPVPVLHNYMLGQPGLGQPGLGQPNLGQPNLGQSGLGQPTLGHLAGQHGVPFPTAFPGLQQPMYSYDELLMQQRPLLHSGYYEMPLQQPATTMNAAAAVMAAAAAANMAATSSGANAAGGSAPGGANAPSAANLGVAAAAGALAPNAGLSQSASSVSSGRDQSSGINYNSDGKMPRLDAQSPVQPSGQANSNPQQQTSQPAANTTPHQQQQQQQPHSTAHQLYNPPTMPPGYNYYYTGNVIPGPYYNPIFPVPSVTNAAAVAAHGTSSAVNTPSYNKQGGTSGASAYGSLSYGSYDEVSGSSALGNQDFKAYGASNSQNKSSSVSNFSGVTNSVYTKTQNINSALQQPYEKSGFAAATPPPFNVQMQTASQSGGGGSSGGTLGAPPTGTANATGYPGYMVMAPQHSQMIAHHLQDPSTGSSRSANQSQSNKTAQKSFSTAYWTNN